LKQFSSTELANRTGDVLAAAAQEPVAIARHGKPRFVMLSTEQYERLRGQGDTRRAFHVSELTDAEADELIRGLQDSIDND
jgi:prevent-host-death family protein